MSACKFCGETVIFTQNWRKQWVLLDPDPPEWRQKTYLEISLGEFVSVFRHECPERETKAQRTGRSWRDK